MPPRRRPQGNITHRQSLSARSACPERGVSRVERGARTEGRQLPGAPPNQHSRPGAVARVRQIRASPMNCWRAAPLLMTRGTHCCCDSHAGAVSSAGRCGWDRAGWVRVVRNVSLPSQGSRPGTGRGVAQGGKTSLLNHPEILRLRCAPLRMTLEPSATHKPDYTATTQQSSPPQYPRRSARALLVGGVHPRRAHRGWLQGPHQYSTR